MVHELTPDDARRLCVRAQLLDAPRPTDAMAVVRRLTLLQVDLTDHVAPSADLVLWSRLGSSYRPEDLERLLDERAVVEYALRLRPAADLALYRAEMGAWPGPEPRRDWQVALAEWVDANDACRSDILAVLREDGPLPARALPDTCDVPWRSSGWTNSRNVQRLLDFMEQRGEVAVAGREGRERLWDLAERVHPDDEAVPLEEALAERARRRLASLGLARAKAPQSPFEPNDVGQAGEAAVVDGVRGRWRVDPTQLARLDEPFEGRVAVLSPIDRLVFDRKRLLELFGFDYQLEMYKPAAQRKWGYWALPVLVGDRLVGKLDASSDHRAGALRVHAFHDDVGLTSRERGEVETEVRALADWLGYDLVDER